MQMETDLAANADKSEKDKSVEDPLTLENVLAAQQDQVATFYQSIAVINKNTESFDARIAELETQVQTLRNDVEQLQIALRSLSSELLIIRLPTPRAKAKKRWFHFVMDD